MHIILDKSYFLQHSNFSFQDHPSIFNDLQFDMKILSVFFVDAKRSPAVRIYCKINRKILNSRRSVGISNVRAARLFYATLRCYPVKYNEIIRDISRRKQIFLSVEQTTAVCSLLCCRSNIKCHVSRLNGIFLQWRLLKRINIAFNNTFSIAHQIFFVYLKRQLFLTFFLVCQYKENLF